jgi:ATP-binding cassette, subfamily B, multidrug efflux pump
LKKPWRQREIERGACGGTVRHSSGLDASAPVARVAAAALAADRWRGIGLLSACYLGVLLLACVAQSFQSYLAAWSGERAMANLRQQLFEHLQQLDIAFFDSNPAGRLVTRVTTDVESLSEMFSGGIVGVMQAW